MINLFKKFFYSSRKRIFIVSLKNNSEPELEPEPQFGFAAPRSRIWSQSRRKYFRLHNTVWNTSWRNITYVSFFRCFFFIPVKRGSPRGLENLELPIRQLGSATLCLQAQGLFTPPPRPAAWKSFLVLGLLFLGFALRLADYAPFAKMYRGDTLASEDQVTVHIYLSAFLTQVGLRSCGSSREMENISSTFGVFVTILTGGSMQDITVISMYCVRVALRTVNIFLAQH